MPNDRNLHNDEQTKKIWNATGNYPGGFTPDVDQAWSQFRSRMHAEPKVRPIHRRRWLQVAASFLLLVSVLGAYRYFQHSPTVEWASVSTGPGESEEVLLPDGSTVVLGEQSLLKYPMAFSDKERPLQLAGMAFFEVERDPARPFRVQAEYGTIEVLGTAFLVRAYPGESTEEVVVQEGRVAYTAPGLQRTELTAQDKLVYRIREKTADRLIDPDFHDLAWHTGVVQFREAPLREVLVTLERYFDIVFDRSDLSSALLDCPISLRFQGHPEREEVLPAISLAIAASLEQTSDTTYRLRGGSCR